MYCSTITHWIKKRDCYLCVSLFVLSFFLSLLQSFYFNSVIWFLITNVRVSEEKKEENNEAAILGKGRKQCKQRSFKPLGLCSLLQNSIFFRKVAYMPKFKRSFYSLFFTIPSSSGSLNFIFSNTSTRLFVLVKTMNPDCILTGVHVFVTARVVS